MTEKEYSHDPHIWPVSQKGLGWVLPRPSIVWTEDEINAAGVIAKMFLAKLETLVTAPPKPKPEPEGSDDLPDVS